MRLPPIPIRTAYLLLAVAVMAFAVYGSLIPFDFRSRTVDEAWDTFRQHMVSPGRRVHRADWLANILLFVPVGFGLTGWLVLDRRRALLLPAIATVIVLGVIVSVSAEFLQVFAHGRISSRHDIIAQTIGCAIGIAAWLIAGASLTRWFRETAETNRDDRLSRVLTGYVVVWAFVNLAPFDFTYDLGELARRVRSGRVSLVPFGGYDGPGFRILWDVLTTTISAVPLGLFGLVGWQSRATRHSAAVALGAGAALVVLMEAAHVFVRGHTADSADVFFGCAGVAIGIALGRGLLDREGPRPLNPTVRMEMRTAAGALVAWAAVLCAYHWLPYDFTQDPDAIERTLRRVSLVPFAGYHSGSAISAFNNLLTKVGLSLPVGILSAFLVREGATAGAYVGWIAGVITLFLVIEAGQMFLPSRVPDPTDILVGVCASLAGLGLGRWMQAGASAPER